MIRQFSEKARRKLKYYVYLYIDPRDGVVFYVGKGTGNRCFHHMKDVRESDKVARIKDLYKLGQRPEIEILKYGLSETQALLVEATAIDLLGIKSLTNLARGHGSRVGSRASVEEIAAQLDAKPAKIRSDHPCVLININRMFRYGMTPTQLYDATRSAWKVSPDRHDAQYAMSVYQGVVREVYTIAHWLPEGETLRNDDPNRKRPIDPSRYEFVGRIADEDVRTLYIDRSVAHLSSPGAQNPIRYVHC
jgi:hypothetical protein